LDNAATSFPKPYKVYEAIGRCLKYYCANPGRSGHQMSIDSGMVVYETRVTISKFFNFENPLQFCFTKNATEALNIALKGILRPNTHVITTSMEHNSVLRPLKYLEKYNGVEVSIVYGNSFGEIDPDSIRKCIKSNTAIIVATLSSNVNGTILPIEEIGRISKEHGILFLLDAAQGAGTINIDVKKMNIDLLALPGHKGLLGPQGTGGLYINENIKINPLLHGGTGSNSKISDQPEMMPDLLESGTLNLPGIAGLNRGIDFIGKFGLSNLELYKQILLERFYEGVMEIRGIKLYSLINRKKNSGILAINIGDFDSSEIVDILDRNYGIAARGGFHCAPLAHETLGTGVNGIVRFSLGCFNTIDEIDYTIKALRKICHRILKYRI
jgi:cysteine desulfurase/selenocysteine lyase